MSRLRSILRAIFRRGRAPEQASAAQQPDASGPQVSQPSGAAAARAATAPVAIAGTQSNWLRVLPAPDLLASVQADKALREIWRQTRLSQLVWESDFLPAIHRYAEFVQLMPASEAHHHAHAGGLLAHTIEMLLAAMTWRNGRLLPESSPIEVIDAQRDEWTYVVFYCALLHDIAKPMTDLRIRWRAKDIGDAVRWMPMAGSLCEIAQGRAHAEYLVEFAPKVERDYGAHSRAAMLLLSRIAPPTALAFLGREPQAFETLNKYLSGGDRDSLVAQIVREADKASTKRALLAGSKARFATAKATPLVDIMMQALQAMLRGGTTLPLNRSGAAGWVFDDSVWFVAKRVADATREWIRKNEPDEAVPGETKNDRLFDTWQEHGCILVNPQSGQAVWYVTVQGAGGRDDEAEAASGAQELEQGAYTHSLTMLRFPLSKLYADATHHPAPMRGHIEVHAKRKAIDADETAEDAAPGRGAGPRMKHPPAQDADAGLSSTSVKAASADRRDAAPEEASSREAAPSGQLEQRREAAPVSGEARKPKRPSEGEMIRAPILNKPRPAPKPTTKPVDAPAQAMRSPEKQTRLPKETERSKTTKRPVFDHDESDYLLDASEMASQEAVPPVRKKAQAALVPVPTFAVRAPAAVPTPPPAPGPARMLSAMDLMNVGRASALPASRVETGTNSGRTSLVKGPAPGTEAEALKRPVGGPKPLLMSGSAPEIAARAVVQEALRNVAKKDDADVHLDPAPVILQRKLPDIPGRDENRTQPGPLALDFLRWVQRSLASREMKYNETGAVVHFVPEGMALVSPLIFKMFAATLVTDAEVADLANRIQREVTRAGWHLAGPNRTNIVRYAVIGRGDAVVSRLAAVVLLDPGRWVQPVPPSNPVLRLE